MPRGPRLDAPGLVHHVRARGIERRKIFLSNRDRKDFLDRLSIVCEGKAAFVYCWALMPNHFHLAIRTGSKPLSTTMRRLLTGYATAYNHRHRRVGHLFQNRYWSKVVEEEEYLLGLVRYIHLNPVRAKIVSDIETLSTFKWTGHATLMGHATYKFQDTDEILSRFSKRASTARSKLVDFMSDPDAENERWVFQGGGLVRSMGRRPSIEETISRKPNSKRKSERQAFDERILGGGKFVEALLEYEDKQMSQRKLSPVQRDQQICDIIRIIAKLADVEINELMGQTKRRNVAEARWAVAWIAMRKLGMTATDVGRALGMGPTSFVRRASRGEKILEDLGIEVNDILAKIGHQ
ncbi:MAG: transposase [Deltaproteobacteria bacterium]|nr:transposase [Deltaproteobacteria bacterium]